MITLSSGITKKIIKEWVEDVYAGLQQGQRVRGKEGCRCFKQEIQGEQSENKCAISATRTHKGLEYCCFKPSCKLGAGVVGGGCAWSTTTGSSSNAGVIPNSGRELINKFALPAGVGAEIPPSGIAWLQQFSIGRVEIARYNISGNAADPQGLYFPIYDLAGSYQGYARRQIGENTGGGNGQDSIPKWINHCPPGTIVVSKPYRAVKTLFIVEDIPSSIRLGKMVNSVALLSSTINKYHINNLIKLFNKQKPDTIVIALDPDANDKAKKMKEVLTGIWTGVKVLKTTADPKWWSDEQLKEVLNHVF